MSSFTDALVIEKVRGNALLWRVGRGFRYWIGHEGSREMVHIAAGEETDLASVPVLRRVFRGDQAAVVHDNLYRTGMYLLRDLEFHGYHPSPITRKRADEIFHEAMLVLEVPAWQAWIYYRTVRACGWWPWRNYRKVEASAA